MGWGSGSSLFNDLIDALNDADCDDAQRYAIYSKMVDAFTDHDWDTLDECVGKDDQYDKVFREIYPEEEDVDELDE
jgi:hypothetical protein